MFHQFCGNDAETMLAAVNLLPDYCEVVDINCGCPQGIAKRGGYGAFLLEEGDKLARIAEKWQASAANAVQNAVRKWITRRRREKLLQQTKEAATFVGSMKPPEDDSEESDYGDDFDEDSDEAEVVRGPRRAERVVIVVEAVGAAPRRDVRRVVRALLNVLDVLHHLGGRRARR